MLGPEIARAQSRELFGVRPRFAFWASAVMLLAFLIREYFVLATVVDVPIRGDIREYVLYAWNLYHHGVFSLSPPDTTMPTPDGYRSPGYPWLLTLCMWLRPHGDDWYPLALQMQVMLGTATVWLTTLLGRRWLSVGWAIAAGLLLAVWPHHVAATGALLSEVTFGFALMAGLYALAIAMDRRRHGVLILAAACFGYAYLVNPLIALFPPAIALLVWREKGRQAALLFVGVFLLPVLALGLRNVQLDTSATQASRVGRAAINMVQGSWPQYHHAWQAQLQGDPGGIAIMQKINKEASLLDAHPAAGFAALTGRLRTAPGYYAAWYLWQKPALLWSWDIQIGPGGVYVLDVSHSPLDTHPLLRESTKLLRILNPLLTLVAFAGALLLLVGALRRVSWAPAAALATAALAFYLTAVHTVFQAEPRYANAYRGIETVLIVTFLQLLAGAWRQWQSRKQAFEPLAK